MKKYVLLLALLTLGGYTCAQDTDFETIQNVFSVKVTHSIPRAHSQKIKDSFLDGDYRTVITDFLKSCEPYNENLNINFFGFDFSVNAKSNGWVNEKCSYEFTAKINRVSSYAKQMLNITADDSEISSIEPKFTCDFDKKQLEIFATEVMKNSNKVPASKEAIYKPAQNDLKSNKRNEEFYALIRNPEVCRIVNEEDVLRALQIFSSTFSE